MKRILLGLCLSFIYNYSFSSDLQKAPQNFAIKNKNYVFIDITKVESRIIFDLNSKTAKAQTKLIFNIDKAGHPLFDLVPKIDLIEINNEKTKDVSLKSPDKETHYKSIVKKLSPGEHHLYIENEIHKNLEFKSSYVKFAFWMSDLTDRMYLEQYLPTNFEFDRFPLDLKLEFKNKRPSIKHRIFTNGKMNTNHDIFTINFPEYFSSSSFYLHITKTDLLPEENFVFKTHTGKNIPITLYGKSSWAISGVQKKTINILKELEKTFGEWSHPSLTIYIAGMGGMEHAGATVTSERALSHELAHSYFARGVKPTNGNAGWMDEAIASWRDNGYRSSSSPNFRSSNMSSHSPYRRYTDKKSYDEGASFIAHLNYLFKQENLLLNSFLKDLHFKYAHQNISTEIFRNELQKYSGLDLTKLFNKYLYGNKRQITKNEENPFHHRYTEADLKELL